MNSSMSISATLSLQEPDIKGDPPSRGVVLLVDDEPQLTRALSRLLTAAGYEVEAVHDGAAAVARFKERFFDVVISDISMPGMGGLELLRAIREKDLDVPVIIMTGGPAVKSAIEAIEYGALRYLIKPVESGPLEDLVARAVRLHQMARVRREALELYRAGGYPLGDKAGLEARFARALDQVWMAYQPIVSWSGRSLFAYEALVRSDEPTMRGPGELFAAAERLDRLHDLGRVIRQRVAETLRTMPTNDLVFVNVHTADLHDATLFAPESPLSQFSSRVVLEITERAALDQVKDLMPRMATLREMGFRIAVDDLGAGYAGLTSFAQLEPEVVKVDMSLVRGVDRSPTKQKLLGSIIGLCQDLEIEMIAEGIETEQERDTLVRLGGDLCQGYLFARPGRPFPVPTF
jgi:EAL domain-containing protein (putative c-di-GMP-specific phosphodiesterase class I)/CheY-like chemotaxis protein